MFRFSLHFRRIMRGYADVLCGGRGKSAPPHTVSTMRITFKFDPEKTLQVIAYLLRRSNSGLDKAKLMKLVYLADRATFIARGVPITGDRQYAMKLGPVPSNTLNLIDGELHPINERVYENIQLNNVRVTLSHDPGDNLLSAEEKAALDDVWRKHGHKPTIPLCRETHALPEYKETYVEDTSTLIPYETIARHSGNPARFRRGRPVISPETAAKMSPPFPPEKNLARKS
jgi:uncharacterized phage-associated protein